MDSNAPRWLCSIQCTVRMRTYNGIEWNCEISQWMFPTLYQSPRTFHTGAGKWSYSRLVPAALLQCTHDGRWQEMRSIARVRARATLIEYIEAIQTWEINFISHFQSSTDHNSQCGCAKNFCLCFVFFGSPLLRLLIIKYYCFSSHVLANRAKRDDERMFRTKSVLTTNSFC